MILVLYFPQTLILILFRGAKSGCWLSLVLQVVVGNLCFIFLFLNWILHFSKLQYFCSLYVFIGQELDFPFLLFLIFHFIGIFYLFLIIFLK